MSDPSRIKDKNNTVPFHTVKKKIKELATRLAFSGPPSTIIRSSSNSSSATIVPALDDALASVSIEPPTHITDAANAQAPNIYQTILTDASQDPAPGRITDTVNAVFGGSKTLLKLIQLSADSFPPLKSAVSGLLAIIDVMEVGAPSNNF